MTILRRAVLTTSFVAISWVGLAPDSNLGLRFIQDAHAVVGAPMTPGSVAGVARRTTRRTVAVVAAADSSHDSAEAATAEQQAATAQQQSATAAQQSATAAQQSATAAQQVAAATPPAAAVEPSGQALPLGTVVTSLPAGCTPVASGGIEYQKCGANYYRTAFQGNNLVYVTAQP
jgi:hypothetical protein